MPFSPAHGLEEAHIDQVPQADTKVNLLPIIDSFSPSLQRVAFTSGAIARKSSPQLSLQLSIPSSSQPSSYSGSPETPLSLSSPITGVVDLTRSVKTISQEPVAQGGLSDIYKGELEQKNLDDASEHGGLAFTKIEVAIKLLRIRSVKDQEAVKTRKRLNREVYVWHRLEHPNIAKLFGTSYHMSGRPAMVMEWYANGHAAAYLERTGDSVDRMALILDVARGLNHLHTHTPPIIHGDLKGNNVLVTNEGRAVLSDFGLSQVIDDLGRPTGFTLSHPDSGPLRWQAPEFMEDEELLIAQLSGDVWAFGCTAYELLTGHIPYAHRARDGLVFKDVRNGIKPWGPNGMEVKSESDRKMRNLLDSCWCFCPELRPTMENVIVQLEKICSST